MSCVVEFTKPFDSYTRARLYAYISKISNGYVARELVDVYEKMGDYVFVFNRVVPFGEAVVGGLMIMPQFSIAIELSSDTRPATYIELSRYPNGRGTYSLFAAVKKVGFACTYAFYQFPNKRDVVYRCYGVQQHQASYDGTFKPHLVEYEVESETRRNTDIATANTVWMRFAKTVNDMYELDLPVKPIWLNRPTTVPF